MSTFAKHISLALVIALFAVAPIATPAALAVGANWGGGTCCGFAVACGGC